MVAAGLEPGPLWWLTVTLTTRLGCPLLIEFKNEVNEMDTLEVRGRSYSCTAIRRTASTAKRRNCCGTAKDWRGASRANSVRCPIDASTVPDWPSASSTPNGSQNPATASADAEDLQQFPHQLSILKLIQFSN